MTNEIDQRFDTLLKAMASGKTPSGRKNADAADRKLVKQKPVEKPD